MAETRGLAVESASNLSQLIHDRQVSPVEVVSACLDRVERLNPEINAICTLSDGLLEQARSQESELAAGRDPGLLAGLPVGIKDVTPTRDLRTTFGSPLYADNIPDQDALVVERLRQAGAIILGKTNTPEFATGGNTFNEVFGITRNPWNPERSAGGSTGGGAAALATGMICLAEGTDLGGSLRIPASFCGMVGLRPSVGLVPTEPSDYLWDTLQVSGGIARTARDVALFLQVTAGPSDRAPLSCALDPARFLERFDAPSTEPIRLAFTPDIAGIGVEQEIGQICLEAVQLLSDSSTSLEGSEFTLDFAWDAFMALRGYWMVAQQTTRLNRVEEMGPNLAGNIRAGLETSMQALGEAEMMRGEVWRRFRELFQEVDFLLTPCMAVPPFPASENYPPMIGGRPMKTYVDWIAPTFLLSLAGLPVASVPVGLDSEGLPVGLQIVGRPRSDIEVLRLADRIQKACPIGLP